MNRHSLSEMATKPWLRIMLAAALVIAGLAPVGVPILSQSAWGQGQGTAQTTGQSARPFIYRLAGGAGEMTRVERSADGGATWDAVGAIGQAVAQLEAVKNNEQVVYARGEWGVWVSQNGGATWTQAATLPSRPQAMTVTSGQQDALYVGTESLGIFRSLDRGATWHALDAEGMSDGSPAPLGVTALAVSAADDTILYTATGYWLGSSQAHFTPLGIYISVDGGDRWFELARFALGAKPVLALKSAAGQGLAVTAEHATGSEVFTVSLTPQLLQSLDARDAQTRRAAARLLGLIGDRAALPALLSHFEDPDLLAGDALAAAIGRLGDGATVATLLEFLVADDEAVRSRAAYALGLLRADEAAPQLAGMLRSDGPLARRRAAEALATIGTSAALAGLAAPLADDALTPARHAAMAGLELAGVRAVPTLVAALGTADATSRRNAAEMLGWLKAKSATAALAQALRDGDAAVRSEAAWALGELATPQARQALARAAAAETDAAARTAALQALERTQEAPAMNLLGVLAGIPASRWTLLALSLMLAAVLLIVGRRPVHTQHAA